MIAYASTLEKLRVLLVDRDSAYLFANPCTTVAGLVELYNEREVRVCSSCKCVLERSSFYESAPDWDDEFEYEECSECRRWNG